MDSKAEHAIIKQILAGALNYDGDDATFEMPADADIKDFYYENVWAIDSIIDETIEFRCSGVQTNLSAPSSRHYESDQVAKKIGDLWVSWTYWHGGGKHGEPEAMDWIQHAYIVDCKEEEVMTVKRTFSEIK